MVLFFHSILCGDTIILTCSSIINFKFIIISVRTYNTPIIFLNINNIIYVLYLRYLHNAIITRHKVELLLLYFNFIYLLVNRHIYYIIIGAVYLLVLFWRIGARRIIILIIISFKIYVSKAAAPGLMRPDRRRTCIIKK